MTRTEVIAIARDVGMCGMLTDVVCTIDELERFAALVAAREREACAQVCESTVWTASIPEWRDMTKRDIAVKSMLACAAAIRARSKP